jgi:hypothetical protein
MALEGRTLLSTIVVNNPTDTPVANQIDLRQAIAQANSDGGGDTIVFSSLFDTPQTITLTGGQLELSGTTSPTTITGPGANLLKVSGNNSSRVFLVDANVSASISGLTITDGNAGGRGSSGGGGLEVLEEAGKRSDAAVDRLWSGTGGDQLVPPGMDVPDRGLEESGRLIWPADLH